MSTEVEPKRYFFRDLHPFIKFGTASDRYAGWIGQIYTPQLYRISHRSHTVGGKSFREEILPPASMVEYFRHFPVLELDYTFYGPLLDENLQQTRIHQALRACRKYLGADDRLHLKVPQIVIAQKLHRNGKYVENPEYLNPEVFTRRFCRPAVEILGPQIAGFVFEQEYQVKKERVPAADHAAALDRFFSEIPADSRYHLEIRTEFYHSKAYFGILQKYGLGHVFSHWTWLPPLRKQFLQAGQRFFNSGQKCIVRLMTPLNMKYEIAYAKAFPFDKPVEGMMSPGMITDTVDIMLAGLKEGVEVNVMINNRAGGNAPAIARELADHFLAAPDN